MSTPFKNLARGLVTVLVLIFGVRSAEAMPQPGEPAPSFRLPNQDGKEVALEDYQGRWLVLYFYPRNMTTGCTIQAGNFQRDAAEYEARNAVVVGISVDNIASHQEFCAKEGLEFTLLSDTAGVASLAYGSLRRSLVGRIAERNTFIIDPEGVIAKVYRGVSVRGHSEEVLADLAELQGE